MNVSAACFRNSESRRTSSVVTSGSFSYTARSAIKRRMSGTSFSVAASIRIFISMRRRPPDFDFDGFERHGADVLDQMVLALIEPRPSSRLAEVPWHRSGCERLSVGDLHDDRFRRVVMHLRRLTRRQLDAI